MLSYQIHFSKFNNITISTIQPNSAHILSMNVIIYVPTCLPKYTCLDTYSYKKRMMVAYRDATRNVTLATLSRLLGSYFSYSKKMFFIAFILKLYIFSL